MPDEEGPAAAIATSGASPLVVTYVGHATLLLELGGVRILTDPNFDPNLGRFLARVSKPGIALADLPKLDALLLSHAHADHLSFDSLDRLPRDIPLYAPPQVHRWLAQRGYRHAVPLPPGTTAQVGRVTLRAATAKHVGARYMVDQWHGEASMYLLDAGDATCFFAGDTALTAETHRLVEEHVTRHARRLDLALLPIGWAPRWKPGFRKGHLTSEDALHLFERLGARYLVPYHWGTFNHVTSTAFDAVTRLRGLVTAFARGHDVHIIEPGQRFVVPRADASPSVAETLLAPPSV